MTSCFSNLRLVKGTERDKRRNKLKRYVLDNIISIFILKDKVSILHPPFFFIGMAVELVNWSAPEWRVYPYIYVCVNVCDKLFIFQQTHSPPLTCKHACTWKIAYTSTYFSSPFPKSNVHVRYYYNEILYFQHDFRNRMSIRH